jgi:hypothetical protein
MSHDCRLSAALPVKVNVTEAAVLAALQPFIEDKTLRLEADAVAVMDAVAYIDIAFYGYGDDSHDSLLECIDSLAKLITAPSWLEVFDYDSGSDDRAYPLFIADAEAGKIVARLNYGLERMQPWVESAIGADAFKDLSQYVLSLPRPATLSGL